MCLLVLGFLGTVIRAVGKFPDASYTPVVASARALLVPAMEKHMATAGKGAWILVHCVQGRNRYVLVALLILFMSSIFFINTRRYACV